MRTLWLLVGIALLVLGVSAIGSRMASERAAAVHVELVRGLAEAEPVTVLADEFTRGFVASRAEIHLEVAGAAGQWLRAQLQSTGLEHARARFGVRLNVELHHGPGIAWGWLMDGAEGEPLVAIAVSEMTADQETARDLGTAFGELPPISFVTEVRMTGAHQTSVVWEPIDLESASTTAPWRAHSSGLDGFFVRAMDGKLNGHLTSAGFEWSGAAGMLSVGGFDLEVQGSPDARGAWSGDVHQRWRDVVWTPTEEDSEESEGQEPHGRWAANDLRIDHRGEGDADEIDWSLDVRIGGGAIDGTPIDAALVTLRMRHLSVGGAAHRSGETTGWLDALLPHLMAGPALDPFRIEITAESGTLVIEGQLRIDPDRATPTRPISALEALDGEIRIAATGELATRLGLDPSIVERWVEAGLATENDEGVLAHFAVNGGKLGEPPAPALPATVAEAGQAEPADSAEPAEAALASEPVMAVTPAAVEPEPPAEAMSPIPVRAPDPVPAAMSESDPAPAKPRRSEAKAAEAAEDALLTDMIADSDSAAGRPAQAPADPVAGPDEVPAADR